MAHSTVFEWFKKKSEMQELLAKYKALREDPNADETAIRKANDEIEALRAEITDNQMKRLRGDWTD